MTAKEQLSHDYFYRGYNCAQSVFAAFHAEMGLDEETALKLMVSMGGGVGGLREICGAFSGAVMALGMLSGGFVPGEQEKKEKLYSLVQANADAFRRQYGTVVCRDLLALNDIAPSPVPAKRDDTYYEVRPCGKYVEACARLVEETLESRPRGA
ncbi:MAG: C-GCAxxG-C-C family protein [Bacillota bacterium]